MSLPFLARTAFASRNLQLAYSVQVGPTFSGDLRRRRTGEAGAGST